MEESENPKTTVEVKINHFEETEMEISKFGRLVKELEECLNGLKKLAPEYGIIIN